jgi:hypothetical protein
LWCRHFSGYWENGDNVSTEDEQKDGREDPVDPRDFVDDQNHQDVRLGEFLQQKNYVVEKVNGS